MTDDPFRRLALAQRRRGADPVVPPVEPADSAPLVTPGGRSEPPGSALVTPGEAFRRAIQARRGAGGWQPIV